jgi:hypothetical protein
MMLGAPSAVTAALAAGIANKTASALQTAKAKRKAEREPRGVTEHGPRRMAVVAFVVMNLPLRNLHATNDAS